jgi:uncharacterized membrane protein HdeD (DUF308 family)
MSTTPITGRPMGRHLTDLTPEAARHWWLFLITGALWLIFSLIVFRFDLDTVTAVGIAVGAVCIAAGMNEFLRLPVSTRGWKVFHTIFGVLFVLVGIVALVYPNRTFVEVAAIFSFFLLFKGVFDAFAALALRSTLDLWWIGLIVGVLEILLAFWAAGNFGREAVLLVVWVGAAALSRGVMEIALAFRLHGMRDGERAEAPPGPPAPA